MVSPTLVILAAGMGSRYGGQKAADPVGPGGESIVDYSIYDAHRAGFERFVFVIRRELEEPLKQMAGARFGKHVSVDYVHQEVTKLPPGFRLPPGRTKPWGTTHAVLTAGKLIHGPFAVINVNDFYGAESYRGLAQHLKSGVKDHAMVGYVLRNTLSDFGSVARGICQVSKDGYLESIVEMKSVERHGGHARTLDAAGQEMRLPGDAVVSMNMWGFMPEVFLPLREQFEKFLSASGSDLNAECYIPTAVNDIVVAGQAKVRVLHTGDAWFGITYREDHSHAAETIRRLIEGGYYPRKLWS